MRNSIVTILLVLAAAVSFAQQPAQPSADAVAQKAIAALGGASWDKARFFSFTFDVERGGKIGASFPQQWDRYTGDYRVSGRDQQGLQFLIIMNVNTKQGRAWKEGIEVVGTPVADMMNLGYRRFINDTYWLLMPLKMMDPGVHREYAGTQTSNGQTYDVVKLSFDQGVGLTSGDQYWAYVNQKTGIVDEWDMMLQSMKADEPRKAIIFHDYGRHGGLLISTRREILGTDQVVKLDNLVVSSEVPKGAFDAPKP